MGNHVTLSDIAVELGVSVPTVHRSINNLGRVSESTRQKVLQKAFEMGYRTKLAVNSISDTELYEVVILCPKGRFYDDILHSLYMNSSDFAVQQIRIEEQRTDLFDSIKQTAALESLLKRSKPLYILAIPVAHPILLNPLIEQLSQKGTKIITFDNDAPDSKRTLYIGPNGYTSGKFCAELYSAILPQSASVAIVPSFVSALNLKERVKGFREVCNKNGKINLLGTFEYIDCEEEAYKVCKQVIDTLNPDAIYANSMFGTYGCARAIEQSQKKIFMIGYDFDKRIKEFITNDTLFGSLYHQQYLQGSYLANAIRKICLEDISAFSLSSQPIMASLILKSNIEDFPC